MLEILITKSSLVFENLTDELYEKLTQKYHLPLEATEEDYILSGEPKYLFLVLHALSYDFDIEIL